MLSRVAERVYWAARYVERVENTARLARVYSQLMFDLPKAVKLNWYTLVQITSNEAYFEEHYEARTEKNCMTMLLTDRNNPTSLISSIAWARENLRTTRDILPREAWRLVNELYLMVQSHEADFHVRRQRNQRLEKIIQYCQAWSGMMSSTMSQNTTYRFIKLGMGIERADMTTRMLDVGGYFVAQASGETEEQPYDSILWANLLKSVSAYFMYRQNVQTEMDGQRVVDFLIHDGEFARSVHFCLALVANIARKLPHSERLLAELAALDAFTREQDSFDVGSLALHDYLDAVQQRLSVIHGHFYDIWFNPKEVA